jgi:hypothetical protein
MINKILLLLILIISLDSKIIRDNDNQVVFDTTSMLMWQDNNDVIFYTYTWGNAISYCENLTNANHSDWRLPNVNELYTIIEFTNSSPAMSSSFGQTSNSKYWSSTTYKYNLAHAWYIDFTSGSSSYQQKTTSTRVRCVRDID